MEEGNQGKIWFGWKMDYKVKIVLMELVYDIHKELVAQIANKNHVQHWQWKESRSGIINELHKGP